MDWWEAQTSLKCFILGRTNCKFLVRFFLSTKYAKGVLSIDTETVIYVHVIV